MDYHTANKQGKRAQTLPIGQTQLVPLLARLRAFTTKVNR
jgi:hypothetical protein